MKILFILFIFFNFLFGSIVIDNSKEKIDNFKMKYYFDSTKKQTIDDIQKTTFIKEIPNQFTLGYTKGNNWFKIEITNNSDKENFIIYINEPFFETANLYYYNNKWEKQSSGLSIPLKDRIIYDTNSAFSIKLKKGETKTYYIETFVKLASFGQISIYKEKSFFTQFKLTSIVLYLFYFGGLFVIIVFNSFLFITLKERVYLYYVLYTFFYAIFIGVFSGFTIYLGLRDFHYELHTVTPLLIIFFLLFSKHFLEIKKYCPNLDDFIKSFIFLYLILAILNFIDVEPWYEVISTTSTILFIFLIYISINVWIRGYIKAKYYLVAILIYMLTISLLAFMVNGWIPNNNISRYSFLFGSFLEFLFFSLMLANRFHDIKRQNQRMLEKKVNKRTKKLNNAQKKLKKLNNTLEEKIEEAIRDIQYKEKLLQQQTRLAQMGETINMIAHQWRQPLGAISSAILSIQTKINLDKYDLSNENQRDEFFNFLDEKHHKINNYVKHLSNTISDFRNYFKPDTKKELVSIDTPINMALQIIEKSISSKGIELELKIETKEYIKIYQNELMQVILNIVKNSKDNFESRNIINRKIFISTKETKNSLIIQICDNAGGVDKSIISKIFDPYFSTKNKNETGLGLYMSKVIIENHHNGKLSVKNIDCGVCFKIELDKNIR
jgi:signal transduction histidine kinase